MIAPADFPCTFSLTLSPSQLCFSPVKGQRQIFKLCTSSHIIFSHARTQPRTYQHNRFLHQMPKTCCGIKQILYQYTSRIQSLENIHFNFTILSARTLKDARDFSFFIISFGESDDANFTILCSSLLNLHIRSTQHAQHFLGCCTKVNGPKIKLNFLVCHTDFGNFH